MTHKVLKSYRIKMSVIYMSSTKQTMCPLDYYQSANGVMVITVTH